MNRDVVIVGAGPVGLMLAAELRRGGADVLVLERLTEPTDQSRGFSVHARTLELWEERGLLDRFPPLRMHQYGHFAGLTGLDFGRLDTPYGMALIPQATTERVLRDWALELGAEIRQGHQVSGLQQLGESVRVEVARPEGCYEVSAGYVVGCDGGRSAVRKLCGIGFPGSEDTLEFFMADLEGVAPDAEILAQVPYFYRSERGQLNAWPIAPDVVRVIVFEHGQPPAPDSEPSLAEIVRMSADIAGVDLRGTTAQWLTSFGNATRLADRYRQGRVLLAGDAAHVHMPAGGQGLNLGIQDAVNLGWKLSLVVRGIADMDLLDTYQDERRPLAARVLVNTQAQFALGMAGPEVEALRSLFTELLEIEAVNLLLAGELSAVGFRYDLGGGGHPLLGCRVPRTLLSAGTETVGTTRLLGSGRGVLLDLDGGAALAEVGRNWPSHVEVVSGRTDHADLSTVRLALVRPDGHVAWVGEKGAPLDGDGLRAAVARWFGTEDRACV
ncbi:FAD-dependent monooxygenase [Streptomyces sp. NPDC001139]